MTVKPIEILVVDDEQGYRDMFTFILEPLGIIVTCAADGQVAVEKVTEKAYDLILIDVHMPRLSGPEAIKIIKVMWPEQKIVVFSSSSDPEYRFEKEAEKDGVVECLFKPVESAELQRVLKKALGIDFTQL